MQRPYPKPRDRVYVKPLKAAGDQPAVVKLEPESGGEMDDIVEMREDMVRTENNRFNLVIDMTINNHCGESVVDSGAQVTVAGDFMIV